jgi:hypothetical protein
MAKRARSNTSASQTSQDAKRSASAGASAPKSASASASVAAEIAPLPVVNEEEPTLPAVDEEAPNMPAEAEEDLVDYDDHNLDVFADDTTLVEPEPAEMVEPEAAEPKLTPEQQAAANLEQAKLGMAWSTSTMFSNTPEIASALGLHKIGESAHTEIVVDGVTYAVTWKVVGIEGVEAAPAATATAPATFATKCRFGKLCNKGAACPFDHTVKARPCTWVNTLQGCSKGANCEFGHELEGVKCTRSKYRSNCVNGKACAYKHLDDVAQVAKPQEKKDGEKLDGEEEKVEKADGETEKEKHTPPKNAPTGPKLPNAPTGPKAANGAGQKRGREAGDDGGRQAQRPRGNND